MASLQADVDFMESKYLDKIFYILIPQNADLPQIP